MVILFFCSTLNWVTIQKALLNFFPDGSFKFNARRKLLKDGETIAIRLCSRGQARDLSGYLSFYV